MKRTSTYVALVLICLFQLAAFTSALAKCPTKVELYENGRVTAVLFDTDWRVDANQPSYNARAQSARVFGPAGATVTFYDDQQFREGENFLTITLKVKGPVTIPLARNFVPANAQQGPGDYRGSTDQYDYVLHMRPAWWHRAGRAVSKIVGHYVPGSGGAVPYSGKYSNYRVDNCSSVLFCQ